MPIYEYICQTCGKTSELIVRSDTRIACEHCGSSKVKKAPSTFAAHTATAPDMPPCAGGCAGFRQGQCGSGLCGGE